jgi:hypothetical protein
MASNTFQSTTSLGTIKITKGNKTPDSPIILYKNTISQSGTYGYSRIIDIAMTVESSFENTDETTITDLLTNSATAPWRGFLYLENTFDKIASWYSSEEQFKFQWLSSSGSIYIPNLNEDQFTAIADPFPTQKMYYLYLAVSILIKK